MYTLYIQQKYKHQTIHDGFSFFPENVLTPDRQVQTVSKNE